MGRIQRMGSKFYVLVYESNLLGENILTSPISPEVIDMHTLNFKPNFKFSRLNFFWGGDPRANWGVRYVALVNL